MTKLFHHVLILGIMVIAPLGSYAYETSTNSKAEVKAETRMNLNLGAPEWKNTEEGADRPGLLRAQANTEVRAEVRAEAAKKWQENGNDENARVKAHAHWMTKRFAVVIERLEMLADRIESRIGKLDDEGKDVAVAVDFLADARTELDNASDGFVALSAKLEAAIEAKSWSKEVFQELRTLAGEIKTDIKEAHQHLMNAVRSLKGEANVEASVSAKSKVEVQ